MSFKKLCLICLAMGGLLGGLASARSAATHPHPNPFLLASNGMSERLPIREALSEARLNPVDPVSVHDLFFRTSAD